MEFHLYDTGSLTTANKINGFDYNFPHKAFIKMKTRRWRKEHDCCLQIQEDKCKESVLSRADRTRSNGLKLQGKVRLDFR